MKSITLAALAGATLLCGCAANNPAQDGQQAMADRGTTSVASYIPRKGGRPDNVTVADKQQLENQRVMENGVNNSGKDW
ncbi:hypothetical protein HH212_14865 [Massilia forsythiae]|uniref:Lipoprotein n=1 Tax=Massilia forsythiae TaxID=2728020 RepID=A0A7Z2VXA3_9BURK|nr:hypothetical protein [Massilia forsythiae]QJE01156.1 hypothetical protein HH212_14865 [Massilia forsythiae]